MVFTTGPSHRRRPPPQRFHRRRLNSSKAPATAPPHRIGMRGRKLHHCLAADGPSLESFFARRQTCDRQQRDLTLPMKKPVLLASLALLTATALPAVAQNGKPDAEGFIRDWLVLAPLANPDGSGADALDKKQFAEEASPAAKEGAVQKLPGKELAWAKVASSTFYVDFKELHPAQSEQVIAWAVAYVVCATEKSSLTLKMNSNDQGKVYLNGKELVKFVDTRTLEKDAEDTANGVTLKKGVNVLVLKVVNEENNWQGSVRFLDQAGKPVTDVRIETKP